MANKKITELNAATSLAATDVVPVVDVSADETKKITTTNLFRTLPDGTAAAPALAFSSDQANGVYLAGTDTVGISTGGTQRVTVDGSGNVSISGDLTVNGATTTVESTTVTIDDKNIELGSVATPTDTTADGGGITLKGATDKEIKWVNSTNYWTFSTGIEVGGHLQIDDNKEIRVGNSQDLKIYHNGSNSVITTTSGSVGDLQIIAQGTNHDLYLQAVDNIFIQPQNGENGIKVIGDGAVELYHNNVKKLETKSDGIDVTGEVQCDSLDVDGAADITGSVTLHGNLDLQDDDKILLGASDDIHIFANASGSFIDNTTLQGLSLRQLADDADIVLQSDNGSGGVTTYLRCDGSEGALVAYHYGSQKLTTKSDGIDVTGEVQCDSLDVDGTVDITGDIQTYGHLDLRDTKQLKLGNSDDLKLYHDGSHSVIEQSGTGHLYIRNKNDDQHIFLQTDNGSGDITSYVKCDGADGAVKLYHYGNEKLNTTSTGVDITGEISVEGSSFSGLVKLGSGSSFRGEVQYIYGGGSNKELRLDSKGTGGIITLQSNGTESARLDSSGRLLLGTTTEGETTADNLTVADSGACGITIRSGTSNTGNFFFSDGTSGNDEFRGYLQYDHASNFLRIGTNAVERFRITSTGAWGIEGANNYGTSGQVLTSNGNDSPTWQDAGQASIGGSNAIGMNDNVKINFGASNDLSIYHDGSHSYIEDAGTGQLVLTSQGTGIELKKNTGENLGKFNIDGSVELYHDNSKKLETVTNGVSVTGNVDLSGELNLMGTGDGEKYLDARLGNGTFHIRGTSGGDASHETLATFKRNGAVKLFYDNSQKFQTKTDGIDVTGEVECDSLDVDGTANISGTTVFQGDVGIGNTTPGNSFNNGKSLAFGDNDTGIRQNGDGVLELWSNNQQCFRVRNTGNLSYKTLSPNSNNSLDLGTSSLRWRNIYTNDLNLSNEGSTNDVDGTWGNYTIQEGEDDLFLINRRNGKKYKFNLTEVS